MRTATVFQLAALAAPEQFGDALGRQGVHGIIAARQQGGGIQS